MDWWLGEGYSDWSLVSGLDRSLVQAVVESLGRRRLSLKKISLNLVSLRGLFDEERGSRATTWNPRNFQAITVPSAAVKDALEALRAGYHPVHDYLVKGQGSARRLDTARHGEVLLERAFSVGFAGPNFFLGHSYRHGADASRVRDMLPVPSETEQQELLAETIRDLDKASKTEPAERARDAFHRQHLYMLDAREFAPALTADVARVNRQRTELLLSLSFPHSYFHLRVGLLDTSKNAPQKRYRRIKSDQGWLDWLRKESKGSFSKDSSEVDNVAIYMENVRTKSLATVKTRCVCLASRASLDPVQEKRAGSPALFTHRQPSRVNVNHSAHPRRRSYGCESRLFRIPSPSMSRSLRLEMPSRSRSALGPMRLRLLS